MIIDKKRLYIISSSILALLLIVLFAPMGSGKILAAILLLPSAIVCFLLFKKRVAPSINSKQVLLIISVIGLLYFSFYYISALSFGFTKTGYGLKSDIIFEYIIPIAIIIVSTEIIRHVLCVQNSKLSSTLAYFIALISEVIVCATIPAITNMATFMDVVGLTLFPGILYNLLYNYLTVRYGALPIVIYKAFTVWLFYLIPYGSAISNTLLGFVNLLLPIAIYFFIDSLYEKKRKYALGNTSPVVKAMSHALTAAALIIMLGVVMLVSNQFTYGSAVIATESMTGELNVGDITIFKAYDGEEIIEGQVIVFERSKSMIVHRVVKIEIINGVAHYYTKGDANEDMDMGYITSESIIGTAQYKLPALGYPTLWIRSLFKR